MTRQEYDALVGEEKAKVHAEVVGILQTCTLAGLGIREALSFMDRGMDAGAVARELAEQGGYDLRSQIANSEAQRGNPRNPLLADAESRRKASEAMKAAESSSLKYKN